MVSCFVTRDNLSPFDVEIKTLTEFGLDQKHSFDEKQGIYLPVRYTDAERFLRQIKLPKQWYCNGFLNMDRLVSKRYLAETLRKTFKPKILHHYLPESYTVWSRLPPPQANDRWVLKKDVQCQKGIKLVYGDPRPHIENDTVVIQRFVDNPLLRNGLKVNFRIYVCVVQHGSSKTLFYSKDGFVYYSTKPYAQGDWITTGYTDSERRVYKDNPTLIYDLLRKLSPTLRTFIRRNIHKALSVVFYPYRKILQAPCEHAFQMFGVDIQVGANGSAVVLEVNKSPDLNAKSDLDGMFKYAIVRKFYEAVLSSYIDPAVFTKLF